MNREDIIKLAREAGAVDLHGCIALFGADPLERLVKAAYAAGAAAEREAMVALAAKQGWAMKNEDPFEGAVREIAAIRARGQA